MQETSRLGEISGKPLKIKEQKCEAENFTCDEIFPSSVVTPL